MRAPFRIANDYEEHSTPHCPGSHVRDLEGMPGQDTYGIRIRIFSRPGIEPNALLFKRQVMIWMPEEWWWPEERFRSLLGRCVAAAIGQLRPVAECN